MSLSLDTVTPYNYNDWFKFQSSLNPENVQDAYLVYLQEWYAKQGGKNADNKTTLKQQYIQLLKDLSYLFGSEEANDPFLKNLDYMNDEDLIYSIPFFAKKLRQIAIVLQKKRHSVKQAKLKYNLVGSNDGFEKLLYQYVLKGFTNTENSITQIPASPFISYFPDLSAVKDTFFIELEELYDTQTYFDSDPSVAIENYVNPNSYSDEYPLNGLTNEEINSIISTRFLPRVAETPLSNVFASYLLNSPLITSVSLSAQAKNLVYNEISASEKYLSETVYGLTAINLNSLSGADLSLHLNIGQGNNFFYWPSADRVFDDSIFSNFYAPILINDSSFVASSATGGDSYLNSDLIFTDKNGVVEGAWLRGPYTEPSQDTMVVTIDGSSVRDFTFPFPGVKLSTRGLSFEGYSVNDTNNKKLLDVLNPQLRAQILEKYYTSTLPASSCDPIYINQTNLVYDGAYPAITSDSSDVITLRTTLCAVPDVYRESDYGAINQAYLYKFTKTDLPILTGTNNIYWPVLVYNQKDSLPLTITNDYCLPISIANDAESVAKGSTAGLTLDTADVIYKIKDGKAVEAAWLGSASIGLLQTTTGNQNGNGNNPQPPIYSVPATNCSLPIDGAIQSTLSIKTEPSGYTSFVWNGVDTNADDVFFYEKHADNCPYGQQMPHDYYTNQDYTNSSPIKKQKNWTTCTCNSVKYSPIGHEGNDFSDYNGMCDLLFADPQNLGSNFNVNNWADTRNLNAHNSPQFAFYKITGGDKEVGWGEGYWKNSNNTKFILKTGRKYVYYRTNLNISSDSTLQTPYLITNYYYPDIKIINNSNQTYDLTIVLDVSKSQSYSLSQNKTIIKNMINSILGSNTNVQISLITFGSTASYLTFLTKNQSVLQSLIDRITIPADAASYQTDIFDALNLAGNILTSNINSSGVSYTQNITDLCNSLSYTLAENSIGSNNFGVNSIPNQPQKGLKKILIFSDGQENIKTGFTSALANNLKQQGIQIYGVDVGYYSSSNGLINDISTSGDYFNLQTYLNSTEGDVNSFAQNLAITLGGSSYTIRPNWRKAIQNSNGTWIGLNNLSDMVLRPGDTLQYLHRNQVTYTVLTNGNHFYSPSISFAWQMKLNGWDYSNNTFSLSSVGDSFGGKPFWGKVYNSPTPLENFNKETIYHGGHIRYYYDYLAIRQPEVSTMTITSGYNIQYKRVSPQSFNWNEPISFNVHYPTYQWNKIIFNGDYPSIADIGGIGEIQAIGYGSNESSDLTLESYSSFKPAYYNYYAINAFPYTENLYKADRCYNSFFSYNTSIVIQPTQPYAHLDNVHYPTIATVSFPSQAVTEKQVGSYLLPEKLGVPYYRGRGYTIELDSTFITANSSVSSIESMFLDIGKYGSRNRGLTKNDQLTPTKITNITNDWIYEPYSSGSKGGVMVDVLENQKLTPYQSEYEIYQKNYYGLARQNDMFEFWTPPIPATWNDTQHYPLTLRSEVPAAEYEDRVDKLLTNMGYLDNWRVDIHNNNYGIYKKLSPLDIGGLYMWFSTDYGLINTISNDIFTPNTLASIDNNGIIKWLDRSGKNNNLFAYQGLPKLSSVNNNLCVYFDVSSNFYNGFNINTPEATMFVVGSYVHPNDTYAQNNVQAIVSFGTYISSVDLNSISKGSLVFSNQNGDFNFIFGNNSGYVNNDITTYEISLSDHGGAIGNFYPPTSSFYLFETVFKQPYAQAYINSQLYADNLGTLVPSDSANLFDTSLYSTGGFWVGSYVSNSLTTPCYISEIIYYNRALSDMERQEIESYLNNKYNIY